MTEGINLNFRGLEQDVQSFWTNVRTAQGSNNSPDNIFALQRNRLDDMFAQDLQDGVLDLKNDDKELIERADWLKGTEREDAMVTDEEFDKILTEYENLFVKAALNGLDTEDQDFANNVIENPGRMGADTPINQLVAKILELVSLLDSISSTNAPQALNSPAAPLNNNSSPAQPVSSENYSSTEDVFQDALGFVAKWEGGEVNDPQDPGGHTNLGVTQATYDSYRASKGLPKQSVSNITKEEAERIYRENYWEASGAAEVAQTNPQLAIAMFNTAVNCGPAVAQRFKEESGGDVGKFLQLQKQYYQSLNGFQRFGEGWMNRTNDLASKLGVTLA